MYGSQGILVPLNPLIDNYAPYLKDIMSKNPIVRKAIAQPDGNIYTLPQLNECMGSLVDKNWIRDPWIEKLGIKKPANLDGLYDTLVKFKNTDFNGNGKADEIPMSGAYRGFTGKYISKYFAGSFGFGRIGGLYEQFIDINANNQAEFIPLNENYKSMLQYINKLYSAGLIDQELFTLNNPRFMAKCEEGNIGAVLGGNNFSFFGGGHMWEYSSIVPLGGKTGSAYWIRVFPLVQTTGTAAITHKNKYPEATMRYLDYLYSDEGTRLARLGVEGVTYSKNPTGPNGKYKYFDFITNDPSGNTQDQMVGKYAIYPGGNIPQLITNDNNLGLAVWPQIVAATEVYLPYLPKEILCLNFAAGEISELNGLRNDILTYIEEMEIKFITGAENFSNWNTFKKDLEQMNVKRYVEIYSAAYKRWNSL
jgi:putative aldouronate transport system substrate-binding protein